jgi:hypothetical protein
MRIAFRFFAFKRLDDSLVPGQPRSVVGLALIRPRSAVGLVRAPTKILCWPPLGPITVCCGPRHWSATATIHCRPHPRSAMIRRWHHPEPATMSRRSGPRPAMMSCRPMVRFWPCTFDWPRPHPLSALLLQPDHPRADFAQQVLQRHDLERSLVRSTQRGLPGPVERSEERFDRCKITSPVTIGELRRLGHSHLALQVDPF